MVNVPGPEAYQDILAEYIRTPSEESLYRVSQLSQGFIEGGLGPEDIIALHFEALASLNQGASYREQLRSSTEGQQFLLEVMITYGVRFKEYLELKLEEGLRDAEARAALERERALDAERIGMQKGELLGVIAHELRTPLAAAQGNLDYAKRLLSQGRIDRLPTLLETTRQALDRLSRLSGDLVEASRDEIRGLTLQPCSLQQVVGQACAWAEATAEVSGVRLEFLTPDVPLSVRGDADGLLTVVGNLLSNAIRYTPNGGRVSVRHGHAAGWAWVEVADTGIGIPEEVQARIFDKFYRAPEARQVESKGLGLGLSLVQQVVSAHGGRVEVESALGRGSTFRVRLPLEVNSAKETTDG